ncbi:MAG: hypothetical protein K8L99_28695 [Anaerolineae bacterium]|nr:hypothetical protein [Anaerolineae bacterium]
MATSWGSLYLPYAEQETVATLLRDTLALLGYTSYDPFGLIPGKAYDQNVRLFVTPPVEGWLRVVGLPQTVICEALSQKALCLSLELNGTEATIDVFVNGQQVEPEPALAEFVRTGADLHQALNAQNLRLAEEPTDPVFDNLSDELQSMAAGVDNRQAQKMFERLSGGLVKKMGQRTGTDADAMSADARGLLGENAPDWNSQGGQRIRAVMGCLTVPENWREPDFVSLRDAYQLHRRRQRKPDARLYPGDAEALAKVPDALDYIPVYGGR